MQVYVSASLDGLDFISKYGLLDYTDSLEPLVIFGLYNKIDYSVFDNHKGKLIVVWQGMDSLSWTEDEFFNIRKKEATHYSISDWIKTKLEQNNIDCLYAPISATTGNANPLPRGESIYFYTSKASLDSYNYYGGDMIEEIEQRTGINVIVADYKTYTKAELFEVYKSCFINLRLTKFDGCPNTNLEMGLMGRRSIYNGDIPMSIKWNGVDDICKSIIDEYNSRQNDNTNIAEVTSVFVNSVNNIFK